MMKNNKYISITLIIISIIQVAIFIKFNINIEDKVNTNSEYSDEMLSFKNVNDDLLSINQLKILEIENKDKSWNAKVMLTGDKDSIKENLKLLKDYSIITYAIDSKNGDFNITLDIIRK